MNLTYLRADSSASVRGRGGAMRLEAISIHCGFACDPTTRAVATPIYQNVAYEFESADEAAAMFNLEV
jgi:O-acetylhomoserine (thiol)-lyase